MLSDVPGRFSRENGARSPIQANIVSQLGELSLIVLIQITLRIEAKRIGMVRQGLGSGGL
jgi:hypothetical protein